MPYNIQTSLEQLEQSLKDIDAARQQVQSVVSSNEDMRKIIAQYVSTLGSLKQEIDSWVHSVKEWQNKGGIQAESTVKSIQETCKKIETDFASKIEEATRSFGDNVAYQLNDIEKVRKTLATEVKSLSALQDAYKKSTDEVNALGKKLNEISKELKESQSSQDSAIAAIGKTVTSISMELDAIKEHYKVLNVLIGKADEINSGMAELGNALNKGISDINNHADTVFTKYNAALSEKYDSLVDRVTKVYKEVGFVKKVGFGVIVLCVAILLVVILK